MKRANLPVLHVTLAMSPWILWTVLEPEALMG